MLRDDRGIAVVASYLVSATTSPFRYLPQTPNVSNRRLVPERRTESHQDFTPPASSRAHGLRIYLRSATRMLSV